MRFATSARRSETACESSRVRAGTPTFPVHPEGYDANAPDGLTTAPWAVPTESLASDVKL